MAYWYFTKNNELTIFKTLNTEEDVGIRTHWWHIFMVIIPDNLNPAYERHSIIWVTHGKNTDNGNTGLPDEHDEYLVSGIIWATTVGLPVGLIFQVKS